MPFAGVLRPHRDLHRRPLHRLHHPGVPAVSRRATTSRPGPWTLGRRYRWINLAAIVFVVIVVLILVPAVHRRGGAVERRLRRDGAQLHADRARGRRSLVAIWWVVSAKNRYTGPVRDRLKRTRCTRETDRAANQPRRPGGPGGTAGMLSLDDLRKEAEGRHDRHGRHRLHRHAGPPVRQAHPGGVLPRRRGKPRDRGLQLPARAGHGDGSRSRATRWRTGREGTATSRSRRTSRRCGGSRGSTARRWCCATSATTTGPRSSPRRGRC